MSLQHSCAMLLSLVLAAVPLSVVFFFCGKKNKEKLPKGVKPHSKAKIQKKKDKSKHGSKVHKLDKKLDSKIQSQKGSVALSAVKSEKAEADKKSTTAEVKKEVKPAESSQSAKVVVDSKKEVAAPSSPLGSQKGDASVRSVRNVREEDDRPSLKQSVKERAGSVKESVKSGMGSVKEKAGEVKDKVKEAVKKTGEAITLNTPPKDEFVVQPEALRFDVNRGATLTLVLENYSNSRKAIKMKCSDNDLFKIKPIFTLIEPNAKAEIEIARLRGNPKSDKLAIVIAEAPAKAKNAHEVFKASLPSDKFDSIIVPISAS